MEIYKMLTVGKEMDVDPLFIMNARRRFLTVQLWKSEGEVSDTIAIEWLTDWDIALFIVTMKGLFFIKRLIKQELAAIDRLIYKHKDQIDDGMIERAKSTPVEIVIEFTRGVTRCINPDHDDKHPSAYYGRRTNRLICTVCQKSWDAIACYQSVHGCDFRQAVKALQ